MDRQRSLGRGCVLAATLAILLLPGSAVANGFDAGGYPAAINVQHEGGPGLNLEGSQVECAKVSLSGSLAESAETLALSPAFSECIAWGFLTATIKAEGCQFVLHAGAEIASNEFSGTTEIACPAGQSIKFAVASPSCEAVIGSQSGLSSTKFLDNTGASPEDFTTQTSLSGIKYTVTKDGFLCPFNGTGEKSGGTYVDSAVIGASAEEEAVFLKVDKQTKLCDKSVAACPFLNTYGARKIAGTLKAGTKAEFVFDWNKAERTPKCEKSTFSGATEKEAGVPLLGSLATLTFGACEAACAVTAKGLPYRMEFRASAVVGNGQLSLVSTGFGDPEVEIDCGEIVCSYFGRVWVSQVKGGANGEIQVSEVLARTGAAGKCEGNLTWTATYTITEPAPLYVTN